MTELKIRCSSSIVPFRERAEKVLGLGRYDYKTDGYDTPVVFLGLYHINDFNSFKVPRIKRYVLWCGGDIQNFKRGYLYGDGKSAIWKSRLSSFTKWRDEIREVKAEHFCENHKQQKTLLKLGIKAEVVPAFWDEIEKFPIRADFTEPIKILVSGHPGREREYGFNQVSKIAKRFPDIEFHFYGADIKGDKNIISHGIIPEEQFNKEIGQYHSCIRCNRHDGLSDVVMKNLMSGGYPITYIPYEGLWNFRNNKELSILLEELKGQKEPNYKARELYVSTLNKYPF